MQISVGRPKDLEKRQRIFDAAKQLFLESGYHGSSMNQIAAKAGVTKLTVYNHFQDKASLFTCAIADTCEQILQQRPRQLTPECDFQQELFHACLQTLEIVNLPEAIKLDHLIFELASQQNPLAKQFYDASHLKLDHVWFQFFTQAQAFNFLDIADPKAQTNLLLSLLFGHRHTQVLLGMQSIPTPEHYPDIIEQAMHLFLLRYQNKKPE